MFLIRSQRSKINQDCYQQRSVHRLNGCRHARLANNKTNRTVIETTLNLLANEANSMAMHNVHSAGTAKKMQLNATLLCACIQKSATLTEIFHRRVGNQA